MNFWDAHAHWSSEKLTAEDQEDWFLEATKAGIQGVVLGGVEPGEWQAQKRLYSERPEFFRMTFGLHPWRVSDTPEEECERSLMELESELRGRHPGLVGLGELGLDFQSRFSEEAKQRQIRFFLRQLKLLGKLRAEGYPYAGVFHVVRAHEEALRMIEECFSSSGSQAQPWGIIHSFSGDVGLASRYQRAGLIPSLSLGILGRGAGKAFDTLKRTVLELSLGSFVLETDAPDQPPKGETRNHPWNLRLLAERLAEWRGRGEKAEAILAASSDTVRAVFQI